MTMLPLARAVVIYDLIVAVVLALDFIFISRKNTAVLAKIPAVLITAVLVGLSFRVESPIEFLAIGTLVIGTALFGYANSIQI